MMNMSTLTSIKCLGQSFLVFFVFEHKLKNFIAIDAIKTKQLIFGEMHDTHRRAI